MKEKQFFLYCTRIFLICCALAVLAAVWMPERWWQFLITAAVLLFSAAVTSELKK